MIGDGDVIYLELDVRSIRLIQVVVGGGGKCPGVPGGFDPSPFLGDPQTL